MALHAWSSRTSYALSGVQHLESPDVAGMASAGGLAGGKLGAWMVSVPSCWASGLRLAAGVGTRPRNDLIRVKDGRGRLDHWRHHLDVGGVDVLGRAPRHDLDWVVGVDDRSGRRTSGT